MTVRERLEAQKRAAAKQRAADRLIAVLSHALDLLRRGHLAAAEQELRDILAEAPRQPSALHLLGAIALQRGQLADALRLIEEAVSLQPTSAAMHSDLGLALTSARRYDEAETHLLRATELKPDFPEAFLNLGNVQRELGRPVDAEASYRKALAVRATFPEALSNLAAILLAQGRPREAAVAADGALQLRPEFAEAWQVRGQIHDALGAVDPALAALRKAVELRPRNPRTHAELASTLMAFGRHAEAIESYRAALALDPSRGEWRRIVGKLGGEGDPAALAADRARFADPATPAESRMHLGFAIGKALEDRADPLAGFPYIVEANALKRATFSYARADSDAAFAEIEATFTPGLFARHAKAGHQDGTPVFVVGMPRSGTTLVEQILASHPDVFGAGELTVLRDTVAATAGGAGFSFASLLGEIDDAGLTAIGSRYVRALRGYSTVADRITDKLPGNFLLIGMIRLALPNATVIHCVRDPLDTCVSIFRNYFGAGVLRYAYDLGELGHYYRLYQHLMAHWRAVLPGIVHDVSYEALVADQEGQSRRLLDLCGLDFRPEVLDFHKTERPVHTASAAQVRSPISAASIGIASRYGDALAPLRAALDGRG